jgi:hypothetical protein
MRVRGLEKRQYFVGSIAVNSLSPSACRRPRVEEGDPREGNALEAANGVFYILDARCASYYDLPSDRFVYDQSNQQPSYGSLQQVNDHTPKTFRMAAATGPEPATRHAQQSRRTGQTVVKCP